MRTRYVLVVAALLSVTVALRAASITYTESTTASGSLGGTSFTDALVTISATGNTADVSESGGLYTIVLPAELTISGLGSTMFTDTIQFVDNQTEEDAGVGDNTNGLGLLFTRDPSFATYNLESAFGPITGDTAYNSGASFNTADGSLIISSAGDSTFQAVVATTPEPSTIALLGTGLLGCTGLLRRRFV